MVLDVISEGQVPLLLSDGLSSQLCRSTDRIYGRRVRPNSRWRVLPQVLALVHFVKRCQEAEWRRLPAIKQEHGKGGGHKGNPRPSPGVAVRLGLERWRSQKGRS